MFLTYPRCRLRVFTASGSEESQDFTSILTVRGREFEDFEGLPRSSPHSKLIRLFTPGIKFFGVF